MCVSALPDKPKRAKEAQDLCVDIIIVHTGLDERIWFRGWVRWMTAASPRRGEQPWAGIGDWSIDQALKPSKWERRLLSSERRCHKWTEYKPAVQILNHYQENVDRIRHQNNQKGKLCEH